MSKRFPNLRLFLCGQITNSRVVFSTIKRYYTNLLPLRPKVQRCNFGREPITLLTHSYPISPTDSCAIRTHNHLRLSYVLGGPNFYEALDL